ncbi:hypothetical protein PTSG_01775 [Salpingoeca rosetta]|uniref:Enoyl reductase (ER) domain-containing protein n=1 Tax=Salpingoeca rosetta (strain ATCC 50818 / BSB-021) TaxID=946362 RepID=F2TYX5_SALR5|nr:uncharacterized protein PTSG_01775 [Salpingoeca rosetta]EGD78799.1 hypothetical protein PTSG_01775 [Salpingoeca rosetta]|eukprot:XP_004997755.1 hypothetical protein PTSG_01775 [Salpingoeca rosetta]
MGFVKVMSVLVVLVAIGLKLVHDNTPPVIPGNLPKEMRALRVHGPGNATTLGDVRVDTIPVPKVERGYVLIRVRAAAINPSDIYFLRGIYTSTGNDPSFPAAAGFEGSGLVVGHGGGLFGHMLLGQRVAFGAAGGGAYAEYIAVKEDLVIPLPAEMNYPQGAFSMVNPLTAIGMLSTGLSEGHQAFVQTAAASSLGKMLLRLSKVQDVPMIHVVRRAAQKQLLVGLGAVPEHVLISTDNDFVPKLRALSKQLRATAAFDAVAGTSTAQLAEALPDGGLVYVYGALSNEPVKDVDPMVLMHGNKRIGGWHLRVWTDNLYFPQKLMYIFKTRALLTTALRTDINGYVSLDNFVTEANKYMGAATNNKRVLVFK